jgi:four helix bundle protein
MESALVSAAQNISEGKGRQHKKEFIQFLRIAQGSLYEVVTLAEVFQGKGVFTKDESIEFRNRCELIDRKLNGLINSVRGVGDKKRTAVASNLIPGGTNE